ncbi:MAG: ATP-binding protein [Oscillospiraceae bacterium]
MEKHVEVERSIIKKYRKPIWNRFIGAVKDYDMVQENDKIAVCISGGKDSFVLAKCMQQLKTYTEVPFELEFICMDPGYREENRQLIEENAELLNIKLHFFDTDIFNYVANQDSGSPCYLCARMRRGYLYKYAKSLGCNKIALGHHFDDVVETVLMSMLYGGELKSMMPKLHSANYEGMELIRPLYLVRESDIIAWTRYNSLRFLQCACRFTEDTHLNEAPHGARAEVKQLLKELTAHNPQAAINIFRATHSVHVGTMPGTVINGEKHSFLDEY